MASSEATLQYVCDQASLGRRLTFKKMFGEYALYVDGKVAALVCDDQLYIKPTPEGRACLGQVREAPPYPGARNYFLLTDELDDAEQLSKILLVTAGALPEPRRTLPAKMKQAQKNKKGGKKG
jgi:TfoX/Sxy family transcriptional regulator of competence genes